MGTDNNHAVCWAVPPLSNTAYQDDRSGLERIEAVIVGVPTRNVSDVHSRPYDFSVLTTGLEFTCGITFSTDSLAQELPQLHCWGEVGDGQLKPPKLGDGQYWVA